MHTFLETKPYIKGENDKSKSQGESNITESGVVDKVTNPQIYNKRRKFFISCVNVNISKRKTCVSITHKIVT